MATNTTVRVRLRYPEYLRGEAQKAAVEAIFADAGFEYEFAFPGASFALPDGFWLDLLVKARGVRRVGV